MCPSSKARSSMHKYLALKQSGRVINGGKGLQNVSEVKLSKCYQHAGGKNVFITDFGSLFFLFVVFLAISVGANAFVQNSFAF